MINPNLKFIHEDYLKIISKNLRLRLRYFNTSKQRNLITKNFETQELRTSQNSLLRTMSYGSPSSRSLRDILYRVAAEFDGGPLLAAVGGGPSATIVPPQIPILNVLVIVEKAVFDVTISTDSVLARVRNLAVLFDVELEAESERLVIVKFPPELAADTIDNDSESSEEDSEDEEAGRLVIEKFPRPYRHPKAEPDEFMSDNTFDG